MLEAALLCWRLRPRTGRSLVITPIRCVLGWNWTPREQLGTALPIVRNSWGPKTHELRQQVRLRVKVRVDLEGRVNLYP